VIVAFAPASEPAQAGRFVRRRWHLIGSDRHPLVDEFRVRSAPPVLEGPHPATAVVIGREFGREDNTRLLNGIGAARRDGGRLVLAHLGGGGGSLVKVAAHEDPRLDVLCLELPEFPTARARRVAFTLANSDGLRGRDLRIDNSGRVTTTVWQPVELPAASNGHRTRTVLVTGGLGGLGVRVARVLAQVCHLPPVILDRVAPDTLPAAASRHLRAIGATVVTADITDGRQVAQALAGLPPVRAVVHCAGVLGAGAVDRLTTYDLARAQGPKVEGLRNVLASLRSLDHLVTFGSIAAEEPHRGLGAYALANELLRRATLDAAANLTGCATVAAQWSLWSGAGMAAQAGAVPQARRMGMTPIPLRSGLAALVRLLEWPPDQPSALVLRAVATSACPVGG
jgi:NAD(P)-dependent dehydrogenase (short-subunit alcohol dehydrogenase family)